MATKNKLRARRPGIVCKKSFFYIWKFIGPGHGEAAVDPVIWKRVETAAFEILKKGLPYY